MYITVLDYSVGDVIIYTSDVNLEEEEIEEFLSEKHNLDYIYYMVTDDLNLTIKPYE